MSVKIQYFELFSHKLRHFLRDLRAFIRELGCAGGGTELTSGHAHPRYMDSATIRCITYPRQVCDAIKAKRK